MDENIQENEKVLQLKEQSNAAGDQQSAANVGHSSVSEQQIARQVEHGNQTTLEGNQAKINSSELKEKDSNLRENVLENEEGNGEGNGEEEVNEEANGEEEGNEEENGNEEGNGEEEDGEQHEEVSEQNNENANEVKQNQQNNEEQNEAMAQEEQLIDHRMDEQVPARGQQQEQKSIKNISQKQKLLQFRKHLEQSSDQNLLKSYVNRLENLAMKNAQKIENLQLIISQNRTQQQEREKYCINLTNKAEEYEKNINYVSNELQQSLSQSQAKSSQIAALQQQLEAYREIGDIRILQRRVEQLEVLVQTQQKELRIVTEESQSLQQQEENAVNKQIFQKIQSQQTQIESNKSKISMLQFQLTKKQRQIKQNSEIMGTMDNQIKQQMEKINDLREQLQERERERENYNKHIYDLEEQVKKLKEKQEKDGNGSREKIELDLEELRNENSILFREFNKVTLEKELMEESLGDLKKKYQHLKKEAKDTKDGMVNRKSYDEIARRLIKCKKCLENSILENKQLRIALANGNQHEHASENQQVFQQQQQQQQQKKPTVSQLSQSQSNLQQYIQVFSTHVEQSLDYLKQTNEILHNTHLQQSAHQIKQKQNLLRLSKESEQSLQKLNTMFERELLYKNQLLDKVIIQNRALREELRKAQGENTETIRKMKDNIFARTSLEMLQTQSMNLLVRNRKLVAERDNWKQLYRSIKDKYEFFMSRATSQQKQDHEMDQQKMESVQNEGGMLEQGQLSAQMNKNSQKAIELKSQQTQTDSKTQLYYNQLKQMLSILKKFPPKTKSIIDGLESQRAELEAMKKKYEQVLQRYNLKFKELKTEKNENDTWRSNAREEIVNQFQDIREIIENDRLTNILRQAKNLIEELEAGADEEEEKDEKVEREEKENDEKQV